MGLLEVFGKAIQLRRVQLYCAHVCGNVLIKLLADLHQLILKLPNLCPRGIVTIDAGTVVVTERRTREISSSAVELGPIE